MRRIWILALLLLALPLGVVYAQEDSLLPVSETGVQYQFGEFILFSVKLSAPAPVTESYILFRANGESVTRVFTLAPDLEGRTSFRYSFEQGTVRPFATIHFWYRVKLQDGRELNSPIFYFQYEDNRFPWQDIEDSQLKVHWYAGDLAFGQAAFDAARRGLAQSRQLLNAPSGGPIDLYIYASATDLQQAIEIGGQRWTGGHASPDLRVGIVSIAPGPEQGLEFDRKLPHEIMHIVTSDLVGEHYPKIPVWLREGLASQVELSANPDYPRALELATQQQSVIPFDELCRAFPAETGRVFLAYAQSQSFVNYLVQKYGQSGLTRLLETYSDSVDCQSGAEIALGRTLTQLENDWRVGVLGENKGWLAVQNLFPYLAILFVILAIPLANALFSRGEKP